MSRAVQQMFDGIAPTYDTLNRVLSLGMGGKRSKVWRCKSCGVLLARG